MVQIFWRDLYCSSCGKITKHRHSIKGDIKLTKPGSVDSKLSKNLADAYTKPDTKWECWACRTKGKKSVRKAQPMFQEEGAFVTLYVNKKTEEEASSNPDRATIDALAQVVSYLEDRLSYVENCLALEKKKRGIRVKSRE